jgi:hypothetical protein
MIRALFYEMLEAWRWRLKEIGNVADMIVKIYA